MVVLPLLAAGFTLVYDMVFVPRPHFTGALLGLSAAYPRTVPTQLLVALASHLVPATVVQKAILLAIFVLAVAGVGRLIGTAGGSVRAAWAGGAIAGGVLYAWNPMVYERLRLGQWTLLLGAALLPWAVHAALRYRRGGPRAGWTLTLWIAALVATGPYVATIGGATALAIALWPTGSGPGRRRSAALVVAGAIALNLVWLVPTVLHPVTPDRAAASLTAFEARSDSVLGTVGSVLTLGGVWRTDLSPPGRSTVAWIPAFALIALIIVYGWRRMRDAPGWADGARTALLVVAAGGLILTLAPAVPGARQVVVWAIRTVPGGGSLRDSQKFAIPFALLVAVAFGHGVAWMLERVPRSRTGTRALAVLLVLLPVALAPTLAWGAGGALGTALYPPSWAAVEDLTVRDPVPGGILILPWHAYVPFPWNEDRTVHQPAILYFSRPVLQASALELGNATLPAEDPWSRAATPAVSDGRPLAPALPALGVRYVLLFKIGDWRTVSPKVRGLAPVVDAADLTLYRAPPPGPVPTYPQPPAGLVIAGDVVAVSWFLMAVAFSVRSRRRRGRPSGGNPGTPERDR